jgi:hypothetical protein
MNSHRCQPWFLWAITLAILVILAATQNWNGLIVAVIVSSGVWYAIVPTAHSRRQ